MDFIFFVIVQILIMGGMSICYLLERRDHEQTKAKLKDLKQYSRELEDILDYLKSKLYPNETPPGKGKPKKGKKQ